MPTIHLEHLAAKLAGTTPDQILAAAKRPDGSVVVVVAPGPKHVYPPRLVAQALAELLTERGPHVPEPPAIAPPARPKKAKAK